MLRNLLPKRFLYKSKKQSIHRINSTAKLNNDIYEIERIRNIGILAHIDAGKTTTTERMLFYSGIIPSMGEVHHGNTVTDYMDQERERGITITSAAITFPWKKFKFNLIDTPGHIDFTNEVEQTLGILDGAIVVLDGSAGVEAQTMTVWKQADRYSIPRLVYVNKMDRKDADFEKSLTSIEAELDTLSLPIQIPLKNDQSLTGLMDIITLEKLIFTKDSQGLKIIKKKVTEEEGSLFRLAREKRKILTDKLSDLDDKLASVIIEKNSLEAVSDQNLVESLRRVTISKKAVPVLLGSSYKNIGVQPLMDAIILYLPSPDMNQSKCLHRYFGDSLSAKAFKIAHDKQKGPVTFFRIMSGKMNKNQKLYNVQKEKSEIAGRIYTAHADDYIEIPEIDRGNIAAVTGLKYTATGDMIASNASSAKRARTRMENDENFPPEEITNLFSTNTRVPDPVFFCSVEPPSLSYQVELSSALEQLQKEDPSLRVIHDSETGQTVLGGMGELHMDIIKNRIRKEYNIDVDSGPLQIAYKETIGNSLKDKFELNHTIGISKHSVTLTLSVLPNHKKEVILLFDQTKESASNLSKIQPRVLGALKNGITAAFMHGPRFGCPVVDVGVMLHWLEIGRGTSDTMVAAALTQAIRKLMTQVGSVLLEPIMQIEIVVAEESSTAVITDLSRRRAKIKNIDVRGPNKVIHALTPLVELLGYATSLRIIASGNASFTMEFSHYQSMDQYEEQKAIQNIIGI